ALFNYTYGTNGLPIPSGAIVNLIDTTKIARDLDRIDTSQTDCAVVFFHWGEEYMRQPSKEQRWLAEFCHQHGAAIVIGSHPHVIQPFETQMDADSIIRAVTVYSLGNFVSNQRDRYKDGGLIVTIDVEKHANEPVSIHPSYTPVWVSLPKYRILPPAVADTFTMSGSNRNLYLQFLDDTRKLLDFNRIFEEI
ncbi:MAG: CapA family protein, partial [Tannerella sp.]|nr:CapA family protein [Tannerella sp.]